MRTIRCIEVEKDVGYHPGDDVELAKVTFEDVDTGEEIIQMYDQAAQQLPRVGELFHEVWREDSEWGIPLVTFKRVARSNLN